MKELASWGVSRLRITYVVLECILGGDGSNAELIDVHDNLATGVESGPPSKGSMGFGKVLEIITTSG